MLVEFPAGTLGGKLSDASEAPRRTSLSWATEDMFHLR